MRDPITTDRARRRTVGGSRRRLLPALGTWVFFLTFAGQGVRNVVGWWAFGVIAALSEEQKTWCRNLAGETQLEQAVILLAACKAVVTNDSGLMHVAAALNRPLVALYGPSSPDFTPPLSNKARVIRLITGYHKVRKGDSAQGYHQSLIDITPARVLEELNALLSSEEA